MGKLRFDCKLSKKVMTKLGLLPKSERLKVVTTKTSIEEGLKYIPTTDDVFYIPVYDTNLQLLCEISKENKCIVVDVLDINNIRGR